MKVLFFTPAVRTSAIGRMSRLVVRALMQQGHSVTVVRTEIENGDANNVHDFGTCIVCWDQIAIVDELSRTADCAVYQVGNSYQFHKGCLDWLPRLPGIVCLHDFFLGHLFLEWMEEHGRGAGAEVLRSWYGETIATDYFSFKSSEEFIERSRIVAPLTEWVASMATAVITHSNWGIERVLNACPGPVLVAALPYDKPCDAISSAYMMSQALRPHRMNILTIGHINKNKRVENIIRAIASSDELRAVISYRLAGRIEDRVALALGGLAAKLGVDLHILGEVDQSTLASEMEEAQIMCCLRIPVLEAASASTIESMLLGKCTLVTDDGFYRQLPDACVVKVAADQEEENIRSALLRLNANRDLIDEIGQRARLYAEVTFSPEKYAAHMYEIWRKVIDAQPNSAAVSRIAKVLSGWGSLRSPDLLSHISEPIAMFGSSCRLANASDLR